MPFDASRRAEQLKSDGRLPSYSLTFDEYGAKVREAQVIFLMTSVSRGPWEVGQSQINNIVVQYGTEGGPKIIHGLSRPDAVLFILQDAWAGQVIFDGHKADEHDFVVLPPSTHFSAATYGPNRWMSISIPTNLFEKGETPIKLNELGWIKKEKRIVSMTPGWTKKLVDQVVDLTDGKSGVPGQNGGYGDVETHLLIFFISAISSANAIINLAENTRSSRSIMHRALEYMRRHDQEALRVTDIANAAKVTERSLHRAFKQQLGIGTARYLKVRKLNMIRRKLCAVDPLNTLTKLLMQHGVGEFGRFASEYRAIFGEKPSDTLRRSTKPAGLRKSAGA